MNDKKVRNVPNAEIAWTRILIMLSSQCVIKVIKVKRRCEVRFDLPQERHWRLLSGWCDTGKMAFENLPLGVSSHVYTACTVNAVRCAGGVVVDDKRIRLEVVGYSCT